MPRRSSAFLGALVAAGMLLGAVGGGHGATVPRFGNPGGRFLVVQNITFEDGYDGAHQATCTATSRDAGTGESTEAAPSTPRAASSRRSTRSS